MASKIEVLTAALAGALGDASGAPALARGELTLVVDQPELTHTMRTLRDRPELRFELTVFVQERRDGSLDCCFELVLCNG